jgi:putative oxidoreductase
VIAKATRFLESTQGRIVVLSLRLVVAAVFLAAAIPKVLDPVTFATDIDNYRMVPDALIGPMAVGFPLLETIVGLSLVTGVYARGGAIVASGLLAAFAIAMIQAIVRGIDLDCGCFGHVVETQVGWLTVTRNVVLMLACAAIALGPDLPLWPLMGRAGRATLSPS